MSNKQKLKLTRIGNENRATPEPRILLGDASMSYHAQRRATSTNSFVSRLIFGDNLLAIKALETKFSGKVTCVFIKPPYNTESAFSQ